MLLVKSLLWIQANLIKVKVLGYSLGKGPYQCCETVNFALMICNIWDFCIFILLALVMLRNVLLFY